MYIAAVPYDYSQTFYALVKAIISYFHWLALWFFSKVWKFLFLIHSLPGVSKIYCQRVEQTHFELGVTAAISIPNIVLRQDSVKFSSDIQS